LRGQNFGGAAMSKSYVTKYLRTRFYILGFLSFLSFILVFFLFPQNVYSLDVTFAWDPNSEENLAGYRVFCHEDGQSYDYKQPAWEGSETTCTIYNLNDNTTYYFVSRAFDTEGLESGNSTELSYQPPENDAPVADAGPDQTVNEGDTVTLDGSNSSDPDGAIASYSWIQTAGTSVALSDATVAQPTFTAPFIGATSEALGFQLTVTDNEGLTNMDTVIINVSSVNQAPVADAGSDQTVNEGDTVTLDGSNSSDPDGAIAAYSWTQTTGTSVTLSDATAARPTFTAPFVGATCETLGFQLTVTDNEGLTNMDPVIITVSNVNQAPIADAGSDQTVNEGDTVTLDGSNSSDPDGAIADYSWTQTTGTSVTLSDATAVQPTFTAPYVGQYGESLTFQLTVIDDDYSESIATCMVTIKWVNEPPSDTPGAVEIGEVSVDHNWKQVEFNKTFIDPVLVAKPLSYNGEDPAVLRIRNVDSKGFEIRIQEWDYLDGAHAVENVSYLVMEQGSYSLKDGTKVEAGRFDTNATGSFVWVDFSQTFNQVPVVTTTVSSFNEEDAVCSRLRNIGTIGFDFCMQEQESNSQIHTTETISYIAWEPSSGTVGNLTFEVNKTDDVITHKLQTIVYHETFMTTPVFLADMQTTNNGDTANLRWQNKDFYGIDIHITEEQSRDSEIKHNKNEVVGYMVFAFTE
jgi:hypothetical protein